MKRSILMADILSSRTKNSTQVLSQFKKIVSKINKKWHRHIKSPLTITLGDEFQGVIDTVANNISIIFDFEEAIVEMECDFKLRYVLNFGEIDTKINEKVAYEMLGSGLTEARQYLANMKKEDHRFFVSLGKSDKINHQTNNAFLVYQSIVDSWKEKDLKAVTSFLQYEDYKKVAEIINVDVSSAWRRKKSLSINEYNAMKEIILFLSEDIK